MLPCSRALLPQLRAVRGAFVLARRGLSRTDRDVHLRPGAWYRRRLQRSFRYIGVGVWLRRDVAATLWDMEQSWG